MKGDSTTHATNEKYRAGYEQIDWGGDARHERNAEFMDAERRKAIERSIGCDDHDACLQGPCRHGE
jgi:hypothetical protein